MIRSRPPTGIHLHKSSWRGGSFGWALMDTADRMVRNKRSANQLVGSSPSPPTGNHEYVMQPLEVK